MKLILLTHARELNKPSNTGQLVQQNYSPTERVIWQRKEPDPALLKIIAGGNTALIYPSDNSVELSKADTFENYILIDSTWQEARKIYNHSPYLQQLPQLKIIPRQSSSYHLRRNQREYGLCTVECAIELLGINSREDDAHRLLSAFQQFQHQAPD